MILGLASTPVIREISEDLNQKTLAMAEERLGQRFPRMVPWMCMVCLTDARVNDTSIFFEQYAKGDLLVRPESLRRIAHFLKHDGKPIVDSSLGPKTGIDSSYWFAVIEDLADAERVWADCYARARSLVLKSDEFFSAIFYELVHFVVPVEAAGKFNNSTHLARGAIFMTAPEPRHPEVTMAIELAHEMGHQALMLFQSVDSLLVSPLDQPVWSAIRKTMRPAIQCMQAASAMAYMMVFIRGALKNAQLDAAEISHLEESYERIVSGMKATLSGLRETCQFTPLGSRLFQEFSQLEEQS